MNQVSLAFLNSFKKVYQEKANSHQSKKEGKQLKISLLYSAALSYTAIIQNKNLELMQNSES